jgi:hypothetical protein
MMNDGFNQYHLLSQTATMKGKSSSKTKKKSEEAYVGLLQRITKQYYRSEQHELTFLLERPPDEAVSFKTLHCRSIATVISLLLAEVSLTLLKTLY